MKVGSLCTGYGGIELGLRLAGENVDLRWLAEFDPALEPLHPSGVPNLGDITRVDWSTVDPVDLLTAGFPCQPFSAAGRQQAEDDHRYLWPAVRDAVEALMPDRVLLENVRNLVSMRKGEIWARILDDLTQLGYGVTWLTLGACRVGAAHHRHRVFALAQARDGGVQRLDVQECGTKAPLLPTPTTRDGDGRGTGDVGYWDRRVRTGRTNGFPLDATVALLPTPQASDNQGGPRAVAEIRTHRGGKDHGPRLRDITAWGRFADAVARHESLYGPAPAPTEPNRNGAPRLSAAFAEWLMCIPVGHVTDALPRKDALRAIGNGVCPPQFAAAWQLLTGATVDRPSDTSIGSGAMTSSTTTTSADVKDIQDRQANARAAVIEAASAADKSANTYTSDAYAPIIEAAMMALVEHWRAEADIWEASKRRGAVGTAKELRAAASRLAGFAVSLTTRPIGEVADPMSSLEGIAQDARSIIEQATWPDPLPPLVPSDEDLARLAASMRPPNDPAGIDFAAVQEATEEENLREMIGPLGASAIMDNPFVSPIINARPNVTIPFFALTEVAAKLAADEDGRRERVSHSYVESYEKCSLAALLRDASRAGHIGAQRPGWSTIGGNAFHAAVNVVELRAIAGIAAPLSISESLWLEHFEMQVNDRRQELAGTPYADPSTWYVSNRGKEGYDWWRVEGAKMLETYLKFHDQAWRAANQTLMVKDSTPCLELAYEMTVRSIDGERGITSKGFIDRAILSLGDHPTHPWHITVVDYKAGARDPISTFQLGEYAHALLLEMGLTHEPPGRPILGSYWLARKGIYTTPVPVIARHPLHELQYRYDAAMRGTTAGVFAPHVTNMCSSCSTIDYCPAQAGRS